MCDAKESAYDARPSRLARKGSGNIAGRQVACGGWLYGLCRVTGLLGDVLSGASVVARTRSDFSKHGSLLAAFGQHLVKPGLVPAHFHRYLIEAYNTRITGDYKAKSNLKPTDSARLIKQAEEFLKLAKQMLGSLSPTQDQTATPESDK